VIISQKADRAVPTSALLGFCCWQTKMFSASCRGQSAWWLSKMGSVGHSDFCDRPARTCFLHIRICCDGQVWLLRAEGVCRISSASFVPPAARSGAFTKTQGRCSQLLPVALCFTGRGLCVIPKHRHRQRMCGLAVPGSVPCADPLVHSRWAKHLSRCCNSAGSQRVTAGRDGAGSLAVLVYFFISSPSTQETVIW